MIKKNITLEIGGGLAEIWVEFRPRWPKFYQKIASSPKFDPWCFFKNF